MSPVCTACASLACVGQARGRHARCGHLQVCPVAEAGWLQQGSLARGCECACTAAGGNARSREAVQWGRSAVPALDPLARSVGAQGPFLRQRTHDAATHDRRPHHCHVTRTTTRRAPSPCVSKGGGNNGRGAVSCALVAACGLGCVRCGVARCSRSSRRRRRAASRYWLAPGWRRSCIAAQPSAVR